MFIINFLLLLIGIALICFGGIIMGGAKGSVYLYMNSKYKNPEEKHKVLKSGRKGMLLFFIGVLIILISSLFSPFIL